MAVDLAAQLDVLRIAIGRVEALAAVAVEWFDGLTWRDVGPLQLERLTHMLGATAEAAAAAVAAVDRFETVIADQQPAEPAPGDRW